MEVWADRHGDLIVHSPDSNMFTLPYHQWGYYGSVTDPQDPTRCAFLSCFEAHHLHDLGLLQVDLPEATRDAVNSQPQRYTVYKHLRQNGWTVRSGLQYGGDFLLYAGPPGQDHAPFVVVVDVGGLTGLVVAGLVRAASGARKQVVIASPVTGTLTVLRRWIPEQERMRMRMC